MRAHAHPPRSPGEVAELRSRGRRVTRQRAVIWNSLVRAQGRHLSAGEVAEAVQAGAPEIHQATVYRALDVFVAEGLARRTELDGRAVFEVAAEHRHHHVVCTDCGTVTHVHDDAVRDALARVEAEAEFELSDAELTFYGRCRSCRGR